MTVRTVTSSFVIIIGTLSGGSENDNNTDRDTNSTQKISDRNCPTTRSATDFCAVSFLSILSSGHRFSHFQYNQCLNSDDNAFFFFLFRILLHHFLFFVFCNVICILMSVMRYALFSVSFHEFSRSHPTCVGTKLYCSRL